MQIAKHALAGLILAGLILIPAAHAQTAGADLEANHKLVRQFHEEVFNQGKADAADKYISADAVDHQAPPGMDKGLAGFKQWLGQLRTAFPDLKVEVHEIVAQGDLLAFRNTMTGTHKGEFMGMAATGKPFKVEAIDLVRFKDGKMVEHWGQMDMMGLMQQLGLDEVDEADAE